MVNDAIMIEITKTSAVVFMKERKYLVKDKVYKL